MRQKESKSPVGFNEPADGITEGSVMDVGTDIDPPWRDGGSSEGFSGITGVMALGSGRVILQL